MVIYWELGSFKECHGLQGTTVDEDSQSVILFLVTGGTFAREESVENTRT